MSTKVAEHCPNCGHSNMPIDTLVIVKKSSVREDDIPLRLWRYHCEDCGWTWANDLQREHNDKEYDRMYRIIHKLNGGMYG